MHNSQAQIGSVNSNQNITNTNHPNLNELTNFIKTLKNEVSRMKLDDDIHEKEKADIELVEKQLNSKNPKLDKIKNRLKSVLNRIGKNLLYKSW